MEKRIYTNCQYSLCGKKLPFPNSLRKYCSNNNKCKNDHHNGVRDLKVKMVDRLSEIMSKILSIEKLLNSILQKRKLVFIKDNYLKLMGIDLMINEVFHNTYTSIDNKYSEYTFKNFRVYHFVDDEKVAVWRSK